MMGTKYFFPSHFSCIYKNPSGYSWIKIRQSYWFIKIFLDVCLSIKIKLFFLVVFCASFGNSITFDCPCNIFRFGVSISCNTCWSPGHSQIPFFVNLIPQNELYWTLTWKDIFQSILSQIISSIELRTLLY